MGFHIADGGKNLPDAVWMDPEQRKEIFSYCPELSLIMDMKLERERCKGDDKMGNIGPTEEEIAAREKEAARKAAVSSASVASVASAKSAASAISVSSVAKAEATATGDSAPAKATDASAPAKVEASSSAAPSAEPTPILD